MLGRCITDNYELDNYSYYPDIEYNKIYTIKIHSDNYYIVKGYTIHRRHFELLYREEKLKRILKNE